MTPATNQTSASSAGETVVHVLRHGEVHNPDGILYGRKPGFHLSERGNAMAQRIADTIGHRDITHVIASPLERAQETAAPTAAARGLEILTDDRVIESENHFEGTPFSLSTLKQPQIWPKLWNPFKPSWGEPYAVVARRMSAAIKDARDLAEGHEAVLVSHQLPIWIARLAAEGRWFVHDPRSRKCSVCSLTSFHFRGGKLLRVAYSEPAADMIPISERGKNFSSGGREDGTT